MHRRLAQFMVWALALTPSIGALAQDEAEEGGEAADSEAADSEAADSEAAADGEVQPKGMDCVPQVSEIETRRPIPLLCQTDREVETVEAKYRMQGDKGWNTLPLKQTEAGWTAELPCSVTARTGTLRLYVFARNAERAVAARIGTRDKPMQIRVVRSSSEPPPALPNKAPPDRCYEPAECPAEMQGSPACPGTKPGKPSKKGWGASCTRADECQKGMACISGACETPPKCIDSSECSGGECVDGVCEMPDPDERPIGPPRHHWLGLHIAGDFALLREARGVCGTETADSENYACFDAGNPYTGVPNENEAGEIAPGFAFGTMRVLLSYELAIKRLLFGVRAGYAFRGAPQDFSPIHLEARALYSLRKDPLAKSFRPYLGLALGHAPVDVRSTVSVVDCGPEDSAGTCPTADDDQLDTLLDSDLAERRELDAYRAGSGFFFGPTLSLWFALSDESVIQFNLNAMLPDVVLEPSLGYVMGL